MRSQIPEKPEKRWDKDEENKNVRVATTISTVAIENSANEILLQCSRGVIKFYNRMWKAASKVFFSKRRSLGHTRLRLLHVLYDTDFTASIHKGEPIPF